MAVTVSYGVNSVTLALEGKTIGQIRDKVGTLIGAPTDSQAQVNGSEPEEGYLAVDGDDVEFLKCSSVKG